MTIVQSLPDNTKYYADVTRYEECIIVTAFDYTKVFDNEKDYREFCKQKGFKEI